MGIGAQITLDPSELLEVIKARTARLREMEGELERLRDSAEMACIDPCGDCAGCNTAALNQNSGGG